MHACLRTCMLHIRVCFLHAWLCVYVCVGVGGHVYFITYMYVMHTTFLVVPYTQQSMSMVYTSNECAVYRIRMSQTKYTLMCVGSTSAAKHSMPIVCIVT